MKYKIAPMVLGVMLAVAGFSLPAQSQERASSAAPQASDHDARLALVRRYFEVIQFDKLMNTTMDSMFRALLADDRIPAEKREMVRAAATDAFAIILPQMVEANVGLYADAFSLSELQQLVSFYESPVGRSIMTKTVMLSRESGDMMTRFTPMMEEEMRRQMCLRMDCSTAPGTVDPAKGR